jgi:uncharacterized damage-inducible protein DinB
MDKDRAARFDHPSDDCETAASLPLKSLNPSLESFMPSTLERLFMFKAWADDELLTDLARLGDEHPVVGHALKALSHTLIVDRIFAAHLRNGKHAYTSANSHELPTLHDLSTSLRTSDLEYVAYTSGLNRKQLTERIHFTFTDGAPGCMSREEMLMHLVVHGAGHRGQIGALMLMSALAPSRDGFTTYLHATEAHLRGRR